MADITRSYTVHELNQLSEEQVWNLPDGGLYLTYDDGTTEIVNTRTTIYTWYLWELFRKFPGVKIQHKHHTDSLGNYNKGGHTNLGTRLIWDTFYNYPKADHLTIWEIARAWYVATNKWYNAQRPRLTAYTTSMDILDSVRLLSNPGLVEPRELFEKGEITSKECHRQITDFLRSGHLSLDGNMIALNMRAGSIDPRQVMQVLAPRYVRDIDGVSFTEPVMRGYAQGYNRLFDKFVESCTASVAQYMIKSPLETSEYNNRMCQLAVFILQGITYGDCGTQSTTEWIVHEEDLEILRGSNYVENGSLIPISEDDTHLIGQTIQLRTLRDCRHSHTGKPCSACAGISGIITPPNAAFGNYLTLDINSDISQTILSTKHVLSSAINTILAFTAADRRFIQTNSVEPNAIHFNPEILDGNWAIRIQQVDAKCINDINNTRSVRQLEPARVTECDMVQFVRYDRHGAIAETHNVQTRLGGAGSPLSSEMLEYMRDNPWGIVGKAYEITLKGWDNAKPFMRSTRRGDDIMGTMEVFKNFIHSNNVTGYKRLADQAGWTQALQAFHEIMRGRIQYNIKQLEIFVYCLSAYMGGDITKDPYRLPKPEEESVFIGLKEAVKSRGVGAALGFEAQKSLFFDISQFTNNEQSVPGSAMDSIWG